MSNLSHAIVSASVMAPAWCTLPPWLLQTQFQALQRRSAERYRQQGITGLLICGGGHFWEWLEGDEVALRAAVAHLQQEDRHADSRVIHAGPSDRAFKHWSLCVLNRPDAQQSVGRQIHWLLACESQRLQQWSPARMARSVIKPPQLFRSGQQVRRVALFGSSSLWISSFLAHLSSQWERPVVRTRVLHGDGLLSESVLEYLDVDHPSLGPLRWLNCSGGILEGTLMPLVVDSLSLAVLFQTQRDAESVLAFNTGCLRYLAHQDHQTPLMAVVGRASVEHMPAVLQAFDEQGRGLDMVQAAMSDNTVVWQALRGMLQHDFESRPPEPDPLFEEDIQTMRAPPSLPPTVAPGHAATPCLTPAANKAHPTGLSGLLEMGGVEAVSWRAGVLTPAQGIDVGTRCLVLRDTRGTGAVDWSAILQTQENAWAGLAGQMPDEPLEQMLVRWTDRLILSCHWPAEGKGVLSLVTRAGWTNEMLLRTQLRDQLALLTSPAPVVM